MRQEGLLDIDEADGILYPEYKVRSREEWERGCPTIFVPRFVRTAHLYISTFGEVRGNFAIAGLLRCVDVRKFEN